MKRPGLAVLAMATCSLLALSACDEQARNSSDSRADRAIAPGTGATVRMVERDVEAPDVFQVDEPGLWDGRPSLGGVWVAHPEAGDPERVIIRNDTNGKFVIGALFRRERENPGPRLQVSSDAAATLGILAGAPTVLNVTALRREETPAEPVAAADTPPQPAPAATAAAPATEAETPPQPRVRAMRDGGIAVASLQPGSSDRTPQRTSPRMAEGAISDVTASAEAAISRAEAAAPQRQAAAAPAIDRPFVQIGIFSVQDNATRTARQMRSAGLKVNVLEEQSQGKTFWRVTVGPSGTVDERGQVLANVRQMGFTDAYAVAR